VSDLGWTGYLLVAAGGSVGAGLRYLAGHWADRPEGLPRGTIAVNIAGSLLLGLLTGLSVGGAAAAVAATGVCGALTTYSSFVVQAHDRGRRLGALTVVLTVVPALVLYAAGALLGDALR
jgi:CrcB protein